MTKRTKQFITYGVGALVVSGIVAWLASSGSSGSSSSEGSSQYSQSSLTAQETSYDFKTISMANGNVSYKFELKNEGAESVKIEKVSTSCMCTAAYVYDSTGKRYGEFGMPGHASAASSKTNVEVGPGETATVEAIFDPAAHGPSGVGLAQRSIYVETNSAKSPKLELQIQAVVTK